MAKGSVGMVMRITGPVVDIKFEPNELPEIFHAVTIEHNGEKFVLEVAQQRGNGEVRCLSMHPTDGMSRGITAVDTGAPIMASGTVAAIDHGMSEDTTTAVSSRSSAVCSGVCRSPQSACPMMIGSDWLHEIIAVTSEVQSTAQ